jgi:uncharacterized membrane protein
MRIRIGSAVLVLLMFASSAWAFTQVVAINGAITIPFEKSADGATKFFSYTTEAGKQIQFFVTRGSDGQVRVAFDACYACFRAKKGFYQAGSFMVCRNCGMKIAIDSISKRNSLGCNPVAIDFQQEDSIMNIRVEEIEIGSQFF